MYVLTTDDDERKNVREAGTAPPLSPPPSSGMVRVLVVAGSPCSGKTTFAAVACAMLNGAGNGDGGGRSGACLVDKDTLEWPLANAALAVAGVAPDSHDCPLYVNTLKGAAYETMERVAEQQVKEARLRGWLICRHLSGKTVAGPAAAALLACLNQRSAPRASPAPRCGCWLG